jgi:hypothetical protein
MLQGRAQQKGAAFASPLRGYGVRAAKGPPDLSLIALTMLHPMLRGKWLISLLGGLGQLRRSL